MVTELSVWPNGTQMLGTVREMGRKWGQSMGILVFSVSVL